MKFFFLKYKFYLELIVFYIKNEYEDFKNNIIVISKSRKMTITFFIILPIIFYILKIQIVFGFLFIIYYLFSFILYNNILKSEHIIKCEEVTLNTKHLYKYSFFNIFLFVPKAKAFLYVYNFLNIIINGNTNKKEKILLLIIIFLVSFFIKIYILLLFGYSYFSIVITSNLVISYFETISWKYENKKAKNQHILINCLLDNKDSVGEADSKKIIIKSDKIIFNADKFVKFFLNKVSKPEKLLKAFSPEKKDLFSKKYVNGHFSWILESLKFKDKNIAKNKTSSSKIKVFKEDGNSEKIDCSDKYSPRLSGDKKPDFLTRTYELNKKKTIINEIPDNMKIKMQNESKNVYNSMIYDKDEVMLYSENGKIYSRGSPLTIKEYSKENKISVYEKIKFLEEFEKSNEEYLSSEEGKNEYNMYKNIMKGNKNFNNLNNDSDNNSPYEDFIN